MVCKKVRALVENNFVVPGMSNPNFATSGLTVAGQSGFARAGAGAGGKQLCAVPGAHSTEADTLTERATDGVNGWRRKWSRRTLLVLARVQTVAENDRH